MDSLSSLSFAYLCEYLSLSVWSNLCSCFHCGKEKYCRPASNYSPFREQFYPPFPSFPFISPYILPSPRPFYLSLPSPLFLPSLHLLLLLFPPTFSLPSPSLPSPYILPSPHPSIPLLPCATLSLQSPPSFSYNYLLLTLPLPSLPSLSSPLPFPLILLYL